MTTQRATLWLLGLTMTAASGTALARDLEVQGDTPCPAGYTLATPAEAEAADLCETLGTWDIVRLAGGGSIDGPGYDCKIRSRDTRTLGNTLCKSLLFFQGVEGDGVCPVATQPASYLVAKANNGIACSTLGTWYIARLEGGGSIDGSGYDCGVRTDDERTLGHTLCAAFEFDNVTGDVPCPSGYHYLTPAEAQARADEICPTLGAWDIARLEGGGSMDGPGYGCQIRDFDERPLGHSLCTDE